MGTGSRPEPEAGALASAGQWAAGRTVIVLVLLETQIPITEGGPVLSPAASPPAG